MTSRLILITCVLALAGSAFAQTKASGSFECPKADPSYTIAVPDREGHTFAITQNKCTVGKPMPIAGLDPTLLVTTTFYERTEASSRMTASAVTTYTNGDKAFTRIAGTLDRATATWVGKWTYTGGTGKLRAVTGGGTFACKVKSSGASTCETTAEYTVPD